MAFKQVLDLDSEITTPLGGINKKTGKKNPSQVEGYYLGSRKVESKKAKSGFAYIHVFQTPNGNLGVWGKTHMDRQVLAVTPGSMMRVTHTGMQATPNGEMYKYKVEVDSDNTIDVGTLSQGNQNIDIEVTDEDSSYPSYDPVSQDSDEDSEYEAPAQNGAAALAAKERAAKVQALLSKNKTKN